MDELLELLAAEVGRREAKQHLANHLCVSYQAVKKWFDRGYMPLWRAVECEYLWGVDRQKLMDPEIVEIVTDNLNF